jgi:hypothetical protein
VHTRTLTISRVVKEGCAIDLGARRVWAQGGPTRNTGRVLRGGPTQWTGPPRPGGAREPFSAAVAREVARARTELAVCRTVPGVLHWYPFDESRR